MVKTWYYRHAPLLPFGPVDGIRQGVHGTAQCVLPSSSFCGWRPDDSVMDSELVTGRAGSGGRAGQEPHSTTTSPSPPHPLPKLPPTTATLLPKALSALLTFLSLHRHPQGGLYPPLSTPCSTHTHTCMQLAFACLPLHACLCRPSLSLPLCIIHSASGWCGSVISSSLPHSPPTTAHLPHTPPCLACLPACLPG